MREWLARTLCCIAVVGLGCGSRASDPMWPENATVYMPLEVWQVDLPPVVNPGSFSVAVSDLEGDDEDAMKAILIEDLRKLALDIRWVKLRDTWWVPTDRPVHIEVREVPGTIRPGTSGDSLEDVEQGHAQARALLQQSGASVLVWGRVLDDGRGDKALELYMTVSRARAGALRSSIRQPEDFHLPARSFRELDAVLDLLVLAQAYVFLELEDIVIEGRLKPLIHEVLALFVPSSASAGDWTPDSRAMVHMVLGYAWWILGEQTMDREILVDAVHTHKTALRGLEHDGLPLDWAAAQNNLGSALRSLGERELDMTWFEEAVDAFQAALDVRTRDRLPLHWATTQNNLGNALRALGRWEVQQEVATKRLEEAVDAFHAALEVRTRERSPLDWATTQADLGRALQVLGARTKGTVHLEESVAAYRAALAVYTRERMPLTWATVQDSLGSALHLLGAREDGTARLVESVAAFRAALEVRSQERMVHERAETHSGLGSVLHLLGQREGGTARLEESVEAFRVTAAIYADRELWFHWAKARNSLGEVLNLLAQRTSSGTKLCEGLEARVDAWEVYRRRSTIFPVEDVAWWVYVEVHIAQHLGMPIDQCSPELRARITAVLDSR